MPDKDVFGVSETDSAFEKLIITKNGDRKTVNDVVELLVAMHHDSKSRDLKVYNMILKHLSEDVRMSNTEFKSFMDGITKKRDAEIERIESDIVTIKDNCVALHEREPRRKSDPSGEDWGLSMNASLDDEEMGDLRRFWRVVKWAAIVTGAAFLVAAGDELSYLLFR